ncbi:hypothetical protein [Halorubrum sp. LN27]|uniref:hypothetical protein n=1 Tax=Halorubrum sp. LN27 TaxID=2801032 RepID=UPI00190E28E3|nr:hypothetical protein [Halorubrum sp. LN27]
MAALALTVLEIAAISVPLIAIVVYQLFNSDLADQMQDDVLEYVAQLLIGTGFLFLISIVAALRWALGLSLSDPAFIAVTTLSFGLSALTVSVLVLPMNLLAITRKDGGQQTLSDTATSSDERSC